MTGVRSLLAVSSCPSNCEWPKLGCDSLQLKELSVTGTVLGLILLSVTCSAAAQISLKLGMSSGPMASILARNDAVETALAVATQPYVILGLGLYGAGAVVWLFVLSRIDVSLAYPFVGLGFILTMALAAAFLGEQVTLLRVVGTLLVVGGVYLVGRS